MKTKLKILSVLMLLIASAFTASAYDFKVDGIYYNKTSGAEVEVTSGDSKYSGSVTIPASVTYGGTTYSVTSIGKWAFEWCSGLTSVTIPNSVTSIGSSAFYYCSGLTAVHISDLAAWCKIEFGDYAANPLNNAHDLYLNYEKVTNLVIPNSVTEIGNYAFSGCSGLTSVTIPNSLTSIGRDCFPANTELLYEDGSSAVIDGVLYNKDKTALLRLIDKSLNTFVILKSVKTIGAYAFYDCSSLTTIFMPNSVTSIGYCAFSGCSGLTSVNIPNSVTEIGSFAFSGCNGLTSVNIPDSLISIGDNAFYECSGLTSVTIGNSVTTIGNNAFDGCIGLTAVHITDVAAWCKIGFYYLYSNPLYYAHNLYLNGEKVTNLVIPKSTQTINNYTFYGCSSFTSIAMPNSVTEIGYSAFYGCSGLTSVTIPNSVTSIGGNAFRYCSGLTSVTIGNSVTTIGDGAFLCCYGLTSVTIGNSVTKIGNYAFYNCSGLASLTIGKSLTSIGNSAFEGCNKLTSVTMPNTMTTIGEKAFYGCSGLESLTIGRNTSEIGDYTFSGCENICTIYSYAGTPPTIYEHTFENLTYAKANLYVPKGCVSIYEADPLWYPFYNILEGDYNGVDDVIADEASGEIVGYYNLQGVRSDDPWKGLNIVVYSDGTRRKIRY